MPRAALEDLLAQRSTLNSRLTSLQHAAARVQRRQRRVAKAEAATAIQKRVCVCLYLLNKCESGCARDYLKKCGIADIEVAMDEVVKMFVAMDDLEADSVLAHTSPAFSNAWATAEQYFAEWKLAAWVQKQNLSKGLAPSRSALARQMSEESKGDVSEKHVSRASSTQWWRRWRRRWNMRLSSLPVGDPISDNAIREKAAKLFSSFSLPRTSPQTNKPKWAHLGTHFGAPGGPKKWSPKCRIFGFLEPISGSIFGPALRVPT